MPGTFGYTESTNIVVVTAGTSGSPADFTSFVTADRAGTADLLPAVGCSVNHTLTYQIRPVEDLALQISFILAGTSAGAGDTLDVTGTDWDGQAQNESIDVSGGDATYNGAYKWRTITDIDCTGWADGTLQVTQPRWGVIWDYGDKQYALTARFNIGDGSTSTFFRTYYEQITWASSAANLALYGTANSTFQSGLTASLGTGRNGSSIMLAKNIGFAIGIDLSRGTVLLYGSHIAISAHAGYCEIGGTSSVINDCSFDNWYLVRNHHVNNWARVRLTRTKLGFITLAAANMVDFHVGYYTATAFYFYNPPPGVELANPSLLDDVSTGTPFRYNNLDEDVYVINADFAFGFRDLTGTNTENLYRTYTCNIHIADKNGANLSGATVLCEDTSGNQVFSVATDANGDIAEQRINYIRYYGDPAPPSSETYSPHKFTISLPGYETLVIDDITVGAKIVWHLELQPLRARNYARSRVQGVQFQ